MIFGGYCKIPKRYNFFSFAKILMRSDKQCRGSSKHRTTVSWIFLGHKRGHKMFVLSSEYPDIESRRLIAPCEKFLPLRHLANPACLPVLIINEEEIGLKMNFLHIFHLQLEFTRLSIGSQGLRIVLHSNSVRSKIMKLKSLKKMTNK